MTHEIILWQRRGSTERDRLLMGLRRTRVDQCLHSLGGGVRGGRSGSLLVSWQH
jgi:hypothetical protein